MIRFERVTYTYPFQTCPAVSDISFSVRPGELVLCTGASGCGKSTIAAVLTGRVSGYTGHVTIGGQELSAVSEASLLKNVTLVSLGSHLFKGTVADNLRMAAPGADDGALWGALEQVNLADFLRSMDGLDTPLTEGGGNLSGGQRQRLALARAAAVHAGAGRELPQCARRHCGHQLSV